MYIFAASLIKEQEFYISLKMHSTVSPVAIRVR